MCGICGKLFFETIKNVTPELISEMCATIMHRGPDDEGLLIDKNFGFGIRRLSIIDVAGGKQPISNEDKNLTIVFNGEIYNYPELKKDLIKKGHFFKTNSDTETVLHAYEEYGIDCLRRFNGMFAFAIWNTKKRTLFIARDRIGIKPLYYYADHEKFLFGSEIKPILIDKTIERKVSFEALDLYLSYMYVPAPYSMFEKIYKLPAGHFLQVENSRVKIEKYWDIQFKPDYKRFEEDFIDEFRELFNDSVKKRMLSEVPLGAFLSGGIDSSAIVATMANISSKPIRTFSIGFKEGGYHDETKYAEQIAKQFNTDHTTFKVDANILQLMDMYVHHFDEPFADYAAFPTYIVAKLAKEYVTVVLTGDGGDEVFAGYDRYRYELLMEQYKRIPAFIRNNIFAPIFMVGKKFVSPNSAKYQIVDAALKRNKQTEWLSDSRYFRNFYKFDSELKNCLFVKNTINRDFAEEELKKHWLENDKVDFINRRLLVDQKTNLPEDMLVKVDRVTMAVSLEARVPFLDHRIIELAATIPSKYKIRNYRLKSFLKNSFADRLPSKIINRPKHGFSSPIDKWLRTELKDLVQDAFLEHTIKSQGLFNYTFINNLINNHNEGKANNGCQIFMLMVFQRWFERFLK